PRSGSLHLIQTSTDLPDLLLKESDSHVSADSGKDVGWSRGSSKLETQCVVSEWSRCRGLLRRCASRGESSVRAHYVRHTEA
ncbi:unnamed protein product, partial [Mycena citricolor]